MSESNNNTPMRITQLEEATAYEEGMYYAVAKAGSGTKKISANVISDAVKDYGSYNYLSYAIGTNLFDKNNSKNIFSGIYIAYATGKKVENASYSAFIVPIDASKEYISINSIYVHVAFLSDYVDLASVASGSVVDGFISGAVGSGSALEGVAIPSSAKFVIISESTTQLSTTQLQYGSECTSYEAFEHILNINDIKDNSIPVKKIKDLSETLKEEFVSYTVGTNLFDKNNQNELITGYYVAYNNGIKAANASYTTFIVPIDASKETLSINSIYAQIAFTTEYVDLASSPVNVAINGYISGAVGQNAALEDVDIPNNAKYAVVSISNIQVSNAQLQYGSECTPYEPFEFLIDGAEIKKNSIPPDALASGYAKSFVVDINGNGDYTSVRTCLDYIRNNNISDVNVYIKEGVYDIEADYTSEEKAASGFIGLIVPKNVALIGIGKKENVILTYTASEATTAVSTLNIMENVDIKNMTIKGNNIRYCVHDDYSYVETSHFNGNNRNIENVDFIGENLTYSIPYGAGTRGDAKWIFNRVRFINKTSYMCFSVHDAVTETKGADYFEFNDCEFIGKGSANIRLCPAQSGFDSEIVFNSCIMQGIRIDSQFTGGAESTTIFKIYGSGNSKNPSLTYYNDHDKLSFPHFPEMCKSAINASNGVLSIGDYVKFSNGTVISGTSADHDGIMFNTCNDGEVAYVNISE